MKTNLRQSMVQSALIKVENIRGRILCVSASEDEMWPWAEMSALCDETIG